MVTKFLVNSKLYNKIQPDSKSVWDERLITLEYIKSESIDSIKTRVYNHLRKEIESNNDIEIDYILRFDSTNNALLEKYKSPIDITEIGAIYHLNDEQKEEYIWLCFWKTDTQYQTWKQVIRPSEMLNHVKNKSLDLPIS